MPTALPLTFCEAVARRDRVEHLGIANDAGLAIVVAFAAVGLALTTDRPTRKYCRQRPKPFHSRQPPWSGLPLRAWPSGPRTIAQASAIFLIRLEEEGCSQAIYCVPAPGNRAQANRVVRSHRFPVAVRLCDFGRISGSLQRCIELPPTFTAFSRRGPPDKDASLAA